MPRDNGATLLVTGVGPSTKAEDLARRFEKIALVSFEEIRDARDADSEMYGRPFRTEVLAPCVSVSFRLYDKVYSVVIGDESGRPHIGKELWYFLCSLSSKQWALLEGRLSRDIEWVGEGQQGGVKVWSRYGSRFTTNYTKHGNDTMKALLEKAYAHLAYALNMVAKGELLHMIYHVLDIYDLTPCGRIQGKNTSILPYAASSYMVDFPKRRLRSLEHGVWISIPLFSYKALQALNQLGLNDRRKEALTCIETGSACISGLKKKELLEVKTEHKSTLMVKAPVKRGLSIDKSGATPHQPISMDELNKEMISAAAEGNLRRVDQRIEQGADVNAVEDGHTALMEAAMGGHTDVVRILLKNRANVHMRTERSLTALLVATCHGHGDVVKLLLNNKADPDDKANVTGSALAAASYRGFSDIVKLLLDYGAVFDDEALEDAIKENRFEVQTILRKAKGLQLGKGGKRSCLAISPVDDRV